MCLFNTRSWNFHLEHFLSNKIYSNYSMLFCCTETNINDSPAKHVDEILDDWNDIHKNTQHGLALCYNMSKLNIIEVMEKPIVNYITNCTGNRKGDCYWQWCTLCLTLLVLFEMTLFHWLMNSQQNLGCWLLVILILVKLCLSMLPKLIL